MPATLNKIKTAVLAGVDAITKPRSQAQLIDKEDVDSQITLGDIDGGIQRAEVEWFDPKHPGYAKLIELGNKRYEESRNSKWTVNGKALTGLTYYAGNQYTQYNDQYGRMEQVKNYDEAVNKTDNIIQTFVERGQARAVASMPESSFTPHTESDEDRKAAEVSRACCDHAHKIVDMPALIEDIALIIETTTTGFIEIGWNPKAKAWVGIEQADGSIVYHEAQVGEPVAHTRLWINCYPDPNSALNNGSIHDGAWFETREPYSVTYIEDRWGQKVEASCSRGGSYGSLQQRLNYTAGNDNRFGSPGDKDAAEVTQVLEKPSYEYPDGRYWVYSGSVMLHAGPWPYEKRDKYPFEPFWYRVNRGSVWGLNMVDPIIDIQHDINKAATKANKRIDYDNPGIINFSNSKINPKDFQETKIGRIINMAIGGQPPIPFNPIQPNNFYFEYRKDRIDMAEYIVGIHELSDVDGAPVSSGRELDTRLEEDKSRSGPIVKRYGKGVVSCDEWFIALYAQYGGAGAYSRLMAVSETPMGVPPGANAAAAKLVDLTALKNGRCRVDLNESSGVARTPAGKAERLDEIMKVAAGLPAPLVDLYLQESQDIEYTPLVTDVINRLKQAEAAEQANGAASVQAQQAAAKQQEITAQTQGQIAVENARVQGAIQIASAQAQAKGEELAIGEQIDAQTERNRALADQANAQGQQQHELALLMAKNQAPPSVAIAVKADPTATASFERLAGAQAADPSDIKEMLMPPKPAPAATAGAKPKSKPNATTSATTTGN